VSTSEVRAHLERLDLNVAFVSAIVERERDGEREVLVQTRWKPDADPVYSGTLEIPAGGIHAYEDVYAALAREVLEETGLRVTGVYPDVRTPTYAPRSDGCFAFVPFCCAQQLAGGIPRLGFVFVCRVADGEPTPQPGEVREIRWMKASELRTILRETPERIFTLQLGALDYYLDHDPRR
jgi:8-oxo-dGTP diphosphatase